MPLLLMEALCIREERSVLRKQLPLGRHAMRQANKLRIQQAVVVVVIIRQREHQQATHQRSLHPIPQQRSHQHLIQQHCPLLRFLPPLILRRRVLPPHGPRLPLPPVFLPDLPSLEIPPASPLEIPPDSQHENQHVYRQGFPLENQQY
jgi:hypothetical protein